MNIEFRHLRHLKNRRMWLSTSGKTWKTIGKNGDTFGKFTTEIPNKISSWHWVWKSDWDENWWLRWVIQSLFESNYISKYTILRYPVLVSGTSCSIWPFLCGSLMMTSVGAFGFSCSLLFIVKGGFLRLLRPQVFFTMSNGKNVGLCFSKMLIFAGKPPKKIEIWKPHIEDLDLPAWKPHGVSWVFMAFPALFLSAQPSKNPMRLPSLPRSLGFWKCRAEDPQCGLPRPVAWHRNQVGFCHFSGISQWIGLRIRKPHQPTSPPPVKPG